MRKLITRAVGCILDSSISQYQSCQVSLSSILLDEFVNATEFLMVLQVLLCEYGRAILQHGNLESLQFLQEVEGFEHVATNPNVVDATMHCVWWTCILWISIDRVDDLNYWLWWTFGQLNYGSSRTTGAFDQRHGLIVDVVFLEDNIHPYVNVIISKSKLGRVVTHLKNLAFEQYIHGDVSSAVDKLLGPLGVVLADLCKCLISTLVRSRLRFELLGS